MHRPDLATAIRAHAQALTDQANDRPEGWTDADRDTIQLVNMAARWVEGMPLARAFGPPGEWGYSHPIGKAIAKPAGDTHDTGRAMLEAALNAYNEEEPDKALEHVAAFAQHAAQAVDEVASEPPKCDHTWKPTGNGTEEQCTKCGAKCPF